METFEKTFPSIKDVAEKVGDSYGFPIYIQLKDFLLSSQLSIIQAIDEWAESKELITEMGLSNEIIHARMLGFNEALSDLRSFLKEAKTKLK